MNTFNVSDLHALGQQLWVARTLIAAVELDLFEIIGLSGKTLDEIAAKGGLNLRGGKMILDALIPLGLLNRDDAGKYTLTETSNKYCLAGTPEYVGPRLLHMSRLWKSWSELDLSVKTGQPYWVRHPEEGRDPKNLIDLAEMLFSRNFAISKKAAKLMGVGSALKGLKILDVAAGSGAWSLAFLAADPASTATAVDFPFVLEMARRKASDVGAADRFGILPGNVREVDFGKGKYDLAILGHICHSEGPEYSEKLIAKTAAAIAPGGKIFIAEMVPDEDRRGPLHPLVFALNMLVNTLEGGTYTFSEYRGWLEKAGLVNAAKLDIGEPDHSPIIIAEKPI